MSMLITPSRFGGISDSHWANVVGLLHFEGTTGSTTYTDSSGTSSWANPVGSSASITTSQKKFGVSSLFANSGGIRTANIVLRPSAPWTCELWFKRNTSGAPAKTEPIVGNGQNNQVAISTSAGGIGLWLNSRSQYVIASSGYPDDTWHFLVIQWDGSQSTLAMDGEVIGTSQYTFSQQAQLFLGGSDSGTQAFPGWIDEARITNGVARSSFDVPTAPFPDG